MAPSDLPATQDQRRLPLFLDANLIILLVVGASTPLGITSHKATKRYTLADYQRLDELCGTYPQVVTLPNVLTEACDLLLNDRERSFLKGLCIDVWSERAVPSRQAADAREYTYLGLADAAIIETVVGSCFLLSDDVRLVAAVLARGGHARAFTWPTLA